MRGLLNLHFEVSEELELDLVELGLLSNGIKRNDVLLMVLVDFVLDVPVRCL